MSATKIILASASPRRRELLAMLGLEFDVVPAIGDETALGGASPGETVSAIALGKAREVASANPDALVIAADTLVYLDGAPLGKPRDAQDAINMLSRLSGRAHEVFTGIAVARRGREVARFERTVVEFGELSADEIRAYVATGEPLDKAGAYGAQGLGALLIRRLEGDFFNVMGLPLYLLSTVLKEDFGLNVVKNAANRQGD
jgi:septum formation protein